MRVNDIKERRSSRVLLLVFAMLAGGLLAVGCLDYRGYEQRYRAEVERQLFAIAELKVDERRPWREERLGAAAVFHTNAGLKLRILLDQTETRAVRPAKAREWIVGGWDYHGVPVIAAARVCRGGRIGVLDNSAAIALFGG